MIPHVHDARNHKRSRIGLFAAAMLALAPRNAQAKSTETRALVPSETYRR